MFDSIAQDIRQQFNFGNAISKLIIINTVVFVTLMIVFAFVALFGGEGYRSIQNEIVSYLALDSDVIASFKRPWVLITHMFLHRGLWHFVFNMLVLYWIGRIFGDLMGDQRVVPLYLLGGFAGILFYWFGSYLFLDGHGIALGASAAIMAIVVAAAMVAPDYSLHLILIGPVRLKYIVVAIIIMNLISVGAMSNVGGVFAHFGGMAMGAYYIYLVRNGTDWAKGINSFLDSTKNLFTPNKNKSNLKVYHKSDVLSKKSAAKDSSKVEKMDDDQHKLDYILDKISKKGISSLSDEEKDFLDNASKS